MKKIGAITVGQTPRTDLIPEIAPILGDSIEIIQMGGLDGLTKEEIQTMTPAPGVPLGWMTDTPAALP